MDAEELYNQLKPHIEELLNIPELSEEGDEALADLCTKLCGPEKAEPAPQIGVDPYRRYAMYSPEGNKAVHAMVETITNRIRAERENRRQLVGVVRMHMSGVGSVHPEIHDTEPEVAIVREINKACDEVGWVHISREDL